MAKPDHRRADEAAEDRPHRLIDPVDTVLALVLIAVCGFFYYVSTGFPEPSMFLGENVLPQQFPQLLLLFIAVMALLLPFEHRLEVKRWPLIRKARRAPVGFNTYLTIGFIVIVLAVAPTIGTLLTILVVSIGMPILWGERRWLLILVYAVLFTALVAYVFSTVLGVFFEPGILNIRLR